MRLYLCICAIDYSPLIIGRVECISYSFSVYQGSLGWHFRSFCATRSQREAAIKDSGLVPHRALFRFLSLPEKEKSQHISTGTAVALIWGIFCKIPQFKVFVGSKLLVFGKKKKIYFGYNLFSGQKEKILLRSLPKTLKWPHRNYENVVKQMIDEGHFQLLLFPLQTLFQVLQVAVKTMVKSISFANQGTSTKYKKHFVQSANQGTSTPQ